MIDLQEKKAKFENVLATISFVPSPFAPACHTKFQKVYHPEYQQKVEVPK